MPRQRIALAAGLALALAATVGIGVTVAAGTRPVATCNPSPALTQGATVDTFTVRCSVPHAAPVTVTQTVTVTGGPTSTPTTSATTSAPPAAGFPTEATTGWQHTGVTLSPYTGPSEVSVDGTVIDGKDIRTCLYVTASNVTIRNSRITCAGSSPTDGGVMVLQQSNYREPNVTGLTLTDVEITRPAGSNGGADYGVLLYGKGVVMTRVNIHNVTSGVHFSGDGVSITDSYLGGFVNISGVDHNDAVIANGGATNVTLRHNTLEVPINQTTPIAMYPEGTPNSYWAIDGNLLNGGGFCIYPGYTKGSEQPNHHISVTGNTFGRKYFSGCGAGGAVNGGVNGARFLDGVGNVWSGNTWQDTGSAVLSN